MEKDNLTLKFLTDLFQTKAEKQIIENIFKGLDAQEIIDIMLVKKSQKND